MKNPNNIQHFEDNIEEYLKKHINPYDLWDNDYILGYYPDVTYIVCADSLQDALEEFGEYCKENNFTGYVSNQQESEDDFGVNGGEYWLQAPNMVQEIEGRVLFDYSIFYALTDEESRQNGEYSERGEKFSGRGSLSDIVRDAENYGLTECEGASWLYNVDPPYDEMRIKEGIETNYSLHIMGQNYNNMKVITDIAKYLNPKQEQNIEPTHSL